MKKIELLGICVSTFLSTWWWAWDYKIFHYFLLIAAAGGEMGMGLIILSGMERFWQKKLNFIVSLQKIKHYGENCSKASYFHKSRQKAFDKKAVIILIFTGSFHLFWNWILCQLIDLIS